MTTQKVGTVKSPLFDKENYIMWKKKMLLFLQVANPKYLDMLKKGPKIPMIIEAEVIEDNVVITKARTYVLGPVGQIQRGVNVFYSFFDFLRSG